MKPARPESTQPKILDAAEQCFATHGYDGTTLREIAHKVGIREPSLYAHFPNKEAIYGAVIDRALQPFMQEMQQWNNAQLTLRELVDIPRKMLQLHAQHPYAAQILHREFSLPAERISPKIMAWLYQFADQSRVFMSGLPEHDLHAHNQQRVVANLIALSQLTLGFFATQGMQQRLLGDAYDANALLEAHLKIVTRVFKSLLI
jgi:AcrR family transcriptional regulator